MYVTFRRFYLIILAMKVHELITYLQMLDLESEVVLSVSDRILPLEDIRPRGNKLCLEGPTYTEGDRKRFKFIDGLRIVLKNKLEKLQ